MNYVITTATNQGTRAYQEDHLLVEEVEGGYLLAVFDGHSRDYTANLCRTMCVSLWNLIEGSIETRLRGLFLQLDAITKKLDAGSTASIVFIPDSLDKIYTANVGDSPIVWKSKNGIRFAPVHNIRTNLPERLAAEKRGGFVLQGYLWKDSEGKGLQMSRSLGDCELRGVVIQEPDIEEDNLKSDSWIMLSSDGIANDYEELMARVCDIEKGYTAQDLVDSVIASRQGHSCDNVTVILFRVM